MLKIQYISDLHLEFPQNKAFIQAHPIEPQADILVMAGDIVPFQKVYELDSFFDKLAEQFKKVYWLPGNHEYYESDIKDRTGEFSEKIRENIILLNNKVIEIEDFTFLFSTLWTELKEENFGAYKEQWPDFSGIKDNEAHFTPEVYNKLYKENVAFLENALMEKDKNDKTVVVTHHLPTFQALQEKYAVSSFKEAFASDLVNLINRTNPAFWIYGHNHHNMSAFEMNGTTLLTNQLGYVQREEQEGFSGSRVLELG